MDRYRRGDTDAIAEAALAARRAGREDTVAAALESAAMRGAKKETLADGVVAASSPTPGV